MNPNICPCPKSPSFVGFYIPAPWFAYGTSCIHIPYSWNDKIETGAETTNTLLVWLLLVILPIHVTRLACLVETSRWTASSTCWPVRAPLFVSKAHKIVTPQTSTHLREDLLELKAHQSPCYSDVCLGAGNGNGVSPIDLMTFEQNEDFTKDWVMKEPRRDCLWTNLVASLFQNKEATEKGSLRFSWVDLFHLKPEETIAIQLQCAAPYSYVCWLINPIN